MPHAEASDELEHCRDLLRDHFAAAVRHGRDPTVASGFGPTLDRYDALLVERAAGAGVDGLPPRPWRTHGDRIAADEVCRRAGIVSDHALLSGPGAR